jgi:hypothetical protein
MKQDIWYIVVLQYSAVVTEKQKYMFFARDATDILSSAAVCYI